LFMLLELNVKYFFKNQKKWFIDTLFFDQIVTLNIVIIKIFNSIVMLEHIKYRKN